jgi:hypothetical protein
MRERRTLTLGDFRGVDFSTSPLNVKANRASNMVNLICDFGKTHKRSGWRERLTIRHEGKAQRINGIFNYEDGDHRDVIVHAGCRFYRLTVDADTGREVAEDITLSGTHAPSVVDPERLEDVRSQAVYNRKRLYIIGCGDYLVYGSWDGGESYQLRRVCNGEDTYTPVTSIGIDAIHYTEARASSAEVLEDVSYTTSYRKNKLQGYTTFTDAGGKEKVRSIWYLDATVDEGTLVTVTNELTGKVAGNEQGGTDLLDENGVAVGSIGFAEGYVALDRGSDQGNEYVKSGFWAKDNGDSVITVTFCHTPTAEEAGLAEEDFVPYADRVGLCRFGQMFGVSGNTDRLFLSGNERFPNVDFFSEADDLTYFPDLNTVAMGSDAQAVVGYARLSDNTLAIFKERVGGADASIFYRTGYLKEELDERGNLEKLLAVFPTTAGNLGEAMISRHASLDFGGDNLMLSRNGVFGIVLADNVATAVRYTRERSRNVNARLLSEPNLSEAVGYSFDGRYYLAVNSHVYVADARYKISTHDDLSGDGSYQYEWWYWEDVPARVFSELGGRLVFGTEDGMICEFDGECTDRTYLHFEEGDLALDIENNQMDFNATLDFFPVEDDRITITTQGVYALYAENFSRVDGERIYVDDVAIMGIHEGERVYADTVGESGLAVGVPYTVDDVDVIGCSFRLLSEGGESIAPATVGFRLLTLVTGRELYATQVTAGDFRLKTHRDGEILVLTDYDGEVPLLPQASICRHRAIRAAWYTPAFDLGSAAYEKTLHSMTMIAEPGIEGVLRFGFETRNFEADVRREVHLHDVMGSGRGFSFEDLTFEDFSFATGFAHSFTKRLFVRGFNYIMFRFLSDEETDCGIGGFEAVFTVNSRKGGVR